MVTAIHPAHRLRVARTLAATGMFRPQRPDRLARTLLTLRRWGPTPAAGYTASAIRYPHAPAVIDELGTLTFEQVAQRTNRLADSLARAGIRERDMVAIMCRNHRYFVEATVACSKLGAGALYLNTAFAGPQIAQVIEREDPVALIYDEEFADLVAEGALRSRRRFIGWCDDPERAPDRLLDDMINAGNPADRRAPSAHGRVVILTSGTTGAPRGAARHQPHSLAPAAALFSRIPLKARETTTIAAPLFHSWGFAHFTLALALSSTLVLRRWFDPLDTLQATADNRATAMIVVPVMLQRMLELPAEQIRALDLGALRIIAASGSALPGELATRVMDVFGDVLYNLYGSTEVAWATVATPADLRAAPGTAGRPPFGTIVRLLDDQGEEVPAGRPGRIFVANEMQFEGYTGGGGKEIVGGLMSTGDVGHFDGAGRLFVVGRDDEMIVSGGENVFPREVEDLIAGMAGVVDVAVIGVPDEQFGARLKAFVVCERGVTLPPEAVRAHVRDNLARYKVPRDVVFVDELPRTSTGKVVKRHLDDGAPR